MIILEVLDHVAAEKPGLPIIADFRAHFDLRTEPVRRRANRTNYPARRPQEREAVGIACAGRARGSCLDAGGRICAWWPGNPAGSRRLVWLARRPGSLPKTGAAAMYELRKKETLQQ
jgi:hypothetical protein